jgi:hypothetical protein
MGVGVEFRPVHPTLIYHEIKFKLMLSEKVSYIDSYFNFSLSISISIRNNNEMFTFGRVYTDTVHYFTHFGCMQILLVNL